MEPEGRGTGEGTQGLGLHSPVSVLPVVWDEGGRAEAANPTLRAKTLEQRGERRRGTP